MSFNSTAQTQLHFDFTKYRFSKEKKTLSGIYTFMGCTGCSDRDIGSPMIFIVLAIEEEDKVYMHILWFHFLIVSLRML